MQPKSKIPFFALLLLIISAVDSNRNLPSAAIFGSPLIFFFFFAAIFFLFPTALVSAELSAISARTGGIYHWVRMAFNDKLGMLAIWLQWMNAVTWYPTILSFLAGTGAYLFDPSLMCSKTYMMISIAGIFWTLTIINLFGIRLSTKFNEFCCLIGTIIPMLALIVLGFIWNYAQKPIQISFTPSALIPSFSSTSQWVALVAIITSFSGLELSGVHIHAVSNAKKTFPKAILLACFIILLTMLCGSLAIATVLPQKEIHLAGGLMQVFSAFFTAFNLKSWIYISSLVIVLGSLGNITNWILSPAKGLLHASESGYFPAFFCKLNRYGVASRILITQAILVTLCCSLFLFLPSVNAFYWFLMTISTLIYMIMYVLMFISVIQLRRNKVVSSFQIPFKNFGLYFTCILGLIGTFITIFVGFIPPPEIEIASPLKYAFMILVGNIVLILPVFLLILFKGKSLKK